MTATKPTLPEHNGESVEAAKIKFGGLGTGFAGLDVQPIFMDLDDVRYFVMKAKSTESPSAKRDNKGGLFWLNRVSAEMMAPIDRETAEKALQSYAEEIQRQRESMDGQMRFNEEEDAAEREAADSTATAAEIAADTAARFSGAADPTDA